MKHKSPNQSNLVILNKSARTKYEILDSYEAGISLTGSEVKSLRLGKGNLKESFVKAREGELYLHNANIPRYRFDHSLEYDPVRIRRLLMQKKQIEKLALSTQVKGRVLLALKIYLRQGKFKVEVALGRGKKIYERREDLKRRDIQRETERTIKDWQR